MRITRSASKFLIFQDRCTCSQNELLIQTLGNSLGQGRIVQTATLMFGGLFVEFFVFRTHRCSISPAPAGLGRCWRGRCSIHLCPSSGFCSVWPHLPARAHNPWSTARRTLRWRRRRLSQERWRHHRPCTRELTWGGLALPNQKGADFISGRQKQPLGLLSAHVFDEPPAEARG